MAGGGGIRNVNRADKVITRGFVPVCALDFQTLRQYSFEDNSTADIPRDFSHICQNGSRVFMMQDGALWVGDFDTMIFSDRAVLDYSVFRMEPLGDGVVIMSDSGLFYVNEKLESTRFIATDIKSPIARASTHGDGVAFGITDANEIIACALSIQQGGYKHPVAKSISSGVLADVKWGSDPKMHYCCGRLWVARDHDIYAYSRGVWSRPYDFGEHTIRQIGDMSGKLVVFMLDNNLLFDVPLVDTTIEQEQL